MMNIALNGLKIRPEGGGTLGSDMTLKAFGGVFLSLMSGNALGCLTRSLIMAPIELCRNSDLFLKKKHFSSSKIYKISAFLKKYLKTMLISIVSKPS